MSAADKNMTATRQSPDSSPLLGSFAAITGSALALAGLQGDAAGVALQAIESAHQVRMSALKYELDDAKRATNAYACMDRANQSCMQYVKRVTGTALEVNARQSAYVDSLAEMRDRMASLIGSWSEGEVTSPTDVILQLEKILSGELQTITPAPPVIVGMAVDHRFSHGTFRNVITQQLTQMTFVGWSLVIHHPRITSALEPTFIGPGGEPTTKLSLLIDGLELVELHH